MTDQDSNNNSARGKLLIALSVCVVLAAGAKGMAAGEIKAVWRWIKRRI